MKSIRLVSPLEPALRNLAPGDWISFRYGMETYAWYVLDNSAEQEVVTVGKQSWMVSHAIGVSYDEVLKGGYRFLGQGKAKWYWRFLPTRNLVTPFHKPKNLWWL